MRSPSRCGPEQLQVAIIGAGATGVELAAELHNTTRKLVAYGLDRIDPEKDIRLDPDRGRRPHPAGAAGAAVERGARSCCEGSGCSVRTAARVAEVLPNGVKLASGEVIPAELVVWAAGVKAPDFLQGPRRARDQPHQPAGGAADAADHARRRHLRDRRLRRLPVARQAGRARAAARAGGAPAGVAPGEADPAPARGQAARADGATATSARWSRSASTPPSAT